MNQTVLTAVTALVVPAPLTGAGTAQARAFTAKSQTGKSYPYLWGAGGKGDASYGVHHHPDNDPHHARRPLFGRRQDPGSPAATRRQQHQDQRARQTRHSAHEGPPDLRMTRG
ncbi:hypothetical protein GCM10017774_50240 [Lentzea cavernae]|uniref:Uncharacterized protein n=1 Tax=Lentzea cavernae TaxID=2020703 RepID=A0ABQ3MSY0_9PSEU|nr:hypothetical protein GCM10017774_50240 [Lentzea cavernae]